MAKPLYAQLLDQATQLAELDPNRPKQASLRRAISSGYYALFHFLIAEACKELVGSGKAEAAGRAVLSRAFTHAGMVATAKSFASSNLPPSMKKHLPGKISPALQEIAQVFVDSQELRHLADYDLAEAFVRPQVLEYLSDVEQAIHSWPTVADPQARKLFLIGLLVGKSSR